jgi:hypothetical protein
VLSQRLIESFNPEDGSSLISLVDSMPIMTCKGRNRTGKVALDITSKGYCSTKNQYYYGMKLHALGFQRKGTIPFPESILFTTAAENDLTVFQQARGEKLVHRTIFGDKIYIDTKYFNRDKTEVQKPEMLTPVRTVKTEVKRITRFNKATNELFSTAVSRVRQPIEAFFNWLNEITNIQRAHKVRSTSGLLIHAIGKIVVAFIHLIL